MHLVHKLIENPFFKLLCTSFCSLLRTSLQGRTALIPA